MNSREKGFLLLTGHLGDPKRHPLTVAQLRHLERCVLRSPRQATDKELEPQDLITLGCDEETALRVCSLMSDEMLLNDYLRRGAANGCVPLTRISPAYPQRLHQCLDLDAPGSIWLKGDMSLLNKPAVALVGSRDLYPENGAFARRVGELAAEHGLALVSGNARGADCAAQESCLKAGGCVISVVADSLLRQKNRERVLYISEEGFDLPFTSQRALSRNRLIHSMGQATFVAQCSNGTGGTWDGTCRNLRGGWSPVYCLADGSAGVARLYQNGARLTSVVNLHEIFGEITVKHGCFADDCHEKDKMVK